MPGLYPSAQVAPGWPTSTPQELNAAVQRAITDAETSSVVEAAFRSQERIEYLQKKIQLGLGEEKEATIRDVEKTLISQYAKEDIQKKVNDGKLERAKKDVRALFTRLDLRGGRGGTRFPVEVESSITDAIDNIFLGQKRASAAESRLICTSRTVPCVGMRCSTRASETGTTMSCNRPSVY